MSRYETVEVPFLSYGDWHCLTRLQIEQEPWLREFLERFRHCFEYDPIRDVYFYKYKEPDHGSNSVP
jgi:hypothetical protein